MSYTMNGYMNSVERENDIFERAIQIESNKISLMVEAYYNKLENDYLLAEQKVMMENGTYDDLTYLYTEANEDADKNKETIFQKIKAFFQKIFDSIKNLFRRGDAYDGDAPKCFMDAANGSGSSEIVNFFKKIGNDFKDGNVIGAIETLGKGGLTAFSVCVAIDKGVESASNVIHYPKKAYLKVKDWFDRLTSELQKIESELIDAAQASKNEKATGFANEVKASLGKIILWVKGKWQKFVSFFNGVKDKITGKDKEKGEDKEKGKDKEKKDEKGQSGKQGESNEQSGEPKELSDELRKKGNEFGKQMKSTADKMNKKIEELVSKKEIKDEDSKKFKDEYDKANSEKGLSNYKTSLSTMLSILRNYTDVKEFENDLKTIDFKYKKLESELKDYTFESYYYMMYDYEIITESDNNIFTNDQLVHELVDILNDF